MACSAVAVHSGVGPGAASSTATALQAMQGARAPHLPHPSAAPGLPAMGTQAPQPALPPLLVLQGDRDRVVDSRNAHALSEAWAQASAARPQLAATSQRGQRLPTLRQDWRVGRRVQVRSITVQGLGHAWSGGAARGSYTDPKGPDASALIGAFVSAAFKGGVA
ncbi:MAG: hypothetical protein EOO29_39900 [Comamonadaceae bacterium]|nr:MAG: hypothetical protein EOO29_39900 [Comamonadaceae bacterium]